jgi:hypothetical protein
VRACPAVTSGARVRPSSRCGVNRKRVGCAVAPDPSWPLPHRREHAPGSTALTELRARVPGGLPTRRPLRAASRRGFPQPEGKVCRGIPALLDRGVVYLDPALEQRAGERSADVSLRVRATDTVHDHPSSGVPAPGAGPLSPSLSRGAPARRRRGGSSSCLVGRSIEGREARGGSFARRRASEETREASCRSAERTRHAIEADLPRTFRVLPTIAASALG